MLPIEDLKTDTCDDIILKDDILFDNSINATLRTAERRISARTSDFKYDSCAAGIDKYLQGYSAISQYGIKSDINRVLAEDFLFLLNEYDLVVPDPDSKGKLNVFIKFRNSDAVPSRLFKVLINLQNHSVYR